MNIIKCPKCESKFDVSRFQPGKKFRCGKCDNVLEVPTAAVQQTARESNPETETTPLPQQKAGAQTTQHTPSKPVLEPLKPPSRPVLEPVNTASSGPALISFDDKPAAATQLKTSAVPPPQPKPQPQAQPQNKPPAQPRLNPQAAEHQSKKDMVTSRRAKKDAPPQKEKQPRTPLTQAQKMKRLFLGATIAAAIIAIILLIIFTKKTNISNVQPRQGAVSINEQYKKKLAEISYEKEIKPLAAKSPEVFDPARKSENPDAAKTLNQLANWCRENGLEDSYKQHLVESVLIDPKLFEEMKQSLNSIYEAKKDSVVSNVDELFKFGQWCAKTGLKEEAIKHLLSATALDEKREDIKNLLYKLDMKCIVTPQKTEWVTKEDYYSFYARDKRIGQVNHFKDTFKLFPSQVKSSDPDSPEFTDYDKPPFYLCITTSPKYNEQLMLEDFAEKLFTFYEEFRKLYGSVLDMESMNQEVLAVYIFETRELYIRFAQAMQLNLPVNVMGHFDPAEGWLMFPADFDDPYRIIFHEGTHQLIHTITQSKAAEKQQQGVKADNMFWFTEGIATYFESFKRDANGRIVQGENVINRERAYNMKAIFDNNLDHIAFSDFLRKQYREFMAEISNPSLSAEYRAQLGSLYYAQAWSFVYFLHNYNEGEYRKKFNEYFRMEVNGEGGIKAFEDIFGNTRKLEDQWVKFMKELEIK